ncbi:glutamic acid-rich protein-like isoform X2 [Dicentrarchus labrax]|uniref:glutamic acid-rich protein-like isoform X2 n=1 Tax=Dicentrarchus labrax TaxID=13489 RepID=UPI0021F64201|nr:glutamic acid-rich protein-like isoform X2 [Dicentrarchus labrax]
MAAPKENLLSLGHLTGMERNTFTKQREHGLKKSVNRPVLLQADSSRQSHQHLAMHLQQRWQELKEREFAAQQHNRQLLHQFEEAQDTLREMLTLNAAMKTIRREYERYLEESTPRWQQQLKEKTQAAQSKRMEEYLNSCLKNTEERVTKSSADQPLLSQGPTTKPQKMDAPQKHHSQISHLDYNQDGSPHLPYTQPSWQTQPQSQTARFPIRAPNQPQGSSHVPPSLLPPPIFPHPFQLHHLAYMPGHHHPRQNPPGWASQQPNYPWSWTAGAAGIPSGSEALWDRLFTEEPPPERRFAHVVGEEAEMSKASTSKRERGGGSRSSHLSQELDVKPVRLSSGPAESSESSRESSQASRERRKKREKRGRSQRTSSEKETCSSQESSRTSSAIITAAVTAAHSSESDASSEKGRTSTRRRRRSEGLSVGSPRAEKVTKERIRSKADDSGSHKDESQPTSEELVSPIDESRSEKVGDRSPEDKSESCTESGSQREEESGSFSTKIENGDEKQESGSSEESSVEEKGEEEEHEDLGDGEEDDGEEKEDSQIDEGEDDEASERKNMAEEEEATGAEEEMEEQESEEKSDQEEHSDRMKNEDGVNGKQDSSQDEESEGGEDKLEEDGESDEEEEEEQRGDEVEEEEERDSEDSIISPQNKSKTMHIIPEEASEEEEEEEEEVEGSKTGSSDSNEFSDEDIEHQLAPQEQSQQKEEKDLKADKKPKAVCDMVEIFQVEMDRPTKTNNPSDSEEFDHFYD